MYEIYCIGCDHKVKTEKYYTTTGGDLVCQTCEEDELYQCEDCGYVCEYCDCVHTSINREESIEICPMCSSWESFKPLEVTYG